MLKVCKEKGEKLNLKPNVYYEKIEEYKSNTKYFPLRLYGIEEFENTLMSTGFNHIVVHGVKDGYGEGTFFYVIECSA